MGSHDYEDGGLPQSAVSKLEPREKPRSQAEDTSSPSPHLSCPTQALHRSEDAPGMSEGDLFPYKSKS